MHCKIIKMQFFTWSKSKQALFDTLNHPNKLIFFVVYSHPLVLNVVRGERPGELLQRQATWGAGMAVRFLLLLLLKSRRSWSAVPHTVGGAGVTFQAAARSTLWTEQLLSNFHKSNAIKLSRSFASFSDLEYEICGLKLWTHWLCRWGG